MRVTDSINETVRVLVGISRGVAVDVSVRVALDESECDIIAMETESDPVIVSVRVMEVVLLRGEDSEYVLETVIDLSS